MRIVRINHLHFDVDNQVNNPEAQAAATAAATGAGVANPAANAAAPAPGGVAGAGGAAGGAADPHMRMTLTKVVYRLKKWKHLLECRVFHAPSEVPLQRCSPYLAQVTQVSVNRRQSEG